MKKFSISLTLLLSIVISSFVLKGGYEIGDEVIDFKLKNVDGKSISMSMDPDKKGYILVFTCNTCPWAKAYEQRIIDLHNKYEAMGYPVIAIQPNDPSISKGDSFDEMKKRASEKKYPFPYLIDETQEVTMAYGATKTPDVFLVKKQEDSYILTYKGTIDDSPRDATKAEDKYVEDAVDELLAGDEVTTTITKGLGCSIKWSASSKEKMN